MYGTGWRFNFCSKLSSPISWERLNWWSPCLVKNENQLVSYLLSKDEVCSIIFSIFEFKVKNLVAARELIKSLLQKKFTTKEIFQKLGLSNLSKRFVFYVMKQDIGTKCVELHR